MIIHHLAILQIIVPFIAALINMLMHRGTMFTVILAALVNMILSVYGLCFSNLPIFYNLGGFNRVIGIELSLTLFSQVIITYLNCSLLLWSFIFAPNYKQELLNFIDSKWHRIIFSIILFSHSAFIGILSTNDLFNLYVFIEISVLAITILLALGHETALHALNYMITSALASTLILLGIGFLLSVTGSLNMLEIKNILNQNIAAYPKITVSAIIFIITGFAAKMACWPFHAWLINAYKRAPSPILIYLSGASSLAISYSLIKFYINFSSFWPQAHDILFFLSILTMLVGAYLAYRADSVDNIILYSLVSSSGYTMMLLITPVLRPLVLLLLINDSVNKMGLFSILGTKVSDSLLNKMSIVIILICSAGIPVSLSFILKISMLEELIKISNFLAITAIVISTAFSLNYHYKIGIKFLFNSNDNIINSKKNYALNLMALVMIVMNIIALKHYFMLHILP